MQGKFSIAIVTAAALAIPLLLQAAPAPWYQWRSKTDGSMACSQTALGAGWERFSGPYRDARCTFRSTAK
jgi:hypothetical protein